MLIVILARNRFGGYCLYYDLVIFLIVVFAVRKEAQQVVCGGCGYVFVRGAAAEGAEV